MRSGGTGMVTDCCTYLGVWPVIVGLAEQAGGGLMHLASLFFEEFRPLGVVCFLCRHGGCVDVVLVFSP